MRTIIIMILLMSNLIDAQERIATFVNFKSGQETITGVLVRPNNYSNTPAVVFQQGSGNHSFEGYEKEAWGPHKFYVEDVLLEQGYAVLYCNKRGLGGSTGNWKKNSFQGRANDAYAAVEYLKSQPFINANRIGISGHSQGGWISQIVAAQHNDIVFVLALAGPTVGVKAQTRSNDSIRYVCQGYTGEKLEKRMKRDLNSKSFGYKMGKSFGSIGNARFWYLIADYNNDEALKAIRCPTLFLFGEYDINVNPEQNINHINELFNNHVPGNFTIKVMKGAQHGFYKVKDQCVGWDEATRRPFDAEFQNEIRNWIKKLD